MGQFAKSLVSDNVFERLQRLEEDMRMLQTRDVVAQDLSEIVPRVSERLDTMGYVSVLKLNSILFFSQNIAPDIAIPDDAFIEDNILEIVLDGDFFQNTGGGQTVKPRLFLGPVGDEVLVSSETELTIGSSNTLRHFEYRAIITQAASGGNNVRVQERLHVESSTAGTGQTISRTTVVSVSTVDNLVDANNCIVQILNGATPTTFQIYGNTITVRVIDGVSSDLKTWWSNVGTSWEMRSDAPTTSYDTFLGVGERISATSILRGLISAPDMTNIPQNAIIDSAYVFLKFSQNLASAAPTMNAYRLLRNPATPTWNQYSPGNNWGTAGCGNSTTDHDGSVVWATRSLSTSETMGTWTSLILDPQEVQKVVDRTYANFYGLLLKMQAEGNDAYRFYTSQDAVVQNRPIWMVNYRLPEGEA